MTYLTDQDNASRLNAGEEVYLCVEFLHLLYRLDGERPLFVRALYMHCFTKTIARHRGALYRFLIRHMPLITYVWGPENNCLC